jgi:hypothetical protein
MKAIYVYEAGKKQTFSAKTRSWANAEKVAQAERDKRDPVRIELARIAQAEADRQTAEAKAKTAKQETMEAALKQWIAGMKSPTATSMTAYRSTANKILRWANRVEADYVSDVTPAMLDKWRSSWSPKAEEKDDKIDMASQSALLTRIKTFFKWATAMEYTPKNPSLALQAITLACIIREA